MKFHPAKCKQLSVTMQRNILDNLPFNVFSYELNNTVIENTSSQVDLGIEINGKLNFGMHCNALVAKANSRLGLLKRTCHFTANNRQKRSFYLSIVRSIFEHCSTIWSPQYSSYIEKFAAIQKRAVKWINGELFASYSDEVFFEKQKELDILPMKHRFIYSDILLMYKIVNGLVPISLPSYITLATPNNVRYTRRNAPIEDLSDYSTLQSSITPHCNAFKNCFFYRTIQRWNMLPISVRQAPTIWSLRSLLTKFLWSSDIVWPD